MQAMNRFETIVLIVIGLAALAVMTGSVERLARPDCCQGAKLPPPPPGFHPGPANDTNAAKYIEYWENHGQK